MKEFLLGNRFSERRDAKKKFASLIKNLDSAKADLAEFEINQKKFFSLLGECRKGRTPIAGQWASAHGYVSFEEREQQRSLLEERISTAEKAVEDFLVSFEKR